MKLSDISGEETFDVLADLIGPILSIAEDEEAARLFQRETPPEGVDARTFAIQKAKASLPVLLRDHKSDLIDIMVALKQVEREEYVSKLGLMSLAKDVMELASDEDFLGFLS